MRVEHEERVLLGHLAEVRAAQLALAVVVSQVEIVEELDDGPAHMMLGVVLRVHMMLGVVLAADCGSEKCGATVATYARYGKRTQLRMAKMIISIRPPTVQRPPLRNMMMAAKRGTGERVQSGMRMQCPIKPPSQVPKKGLGLRVLVEVFAIRPMCC